MKMEGKLPVGRPRLRWKDPVRKDVKIQEENVNFFFFLISSGFSHHVGSPV